MDAQVAYLSNGFYIVDPRVNHRVPCWLSFRRQINHFRSLEYLEIENRTLHLQDNELELPRLKTLRFKKCRFWGEHVQVVLNTPLLENFCESKEEIRTTTRAVLKLSNFKFLFPHQLKYLQIRNRERNFKLSTEFVNLECLVIHGQ